MHNEVEVFADTILMVLITIAAIILMRVDPLLPTMWVAASLLMTQRRSP